MKPFASADEVNARVVDGVGQMLAGLYSLIEPIFPTIGFIVVFVFVIQFIFSKKKRY